MSFLGVFLYLWLNLLPSSVLTSPTVALPYGVVQGIRGYANSEGVPLGRPLTAYFSIPYASAPRFAYAAPPARIHGVHRLTDYGPVCPQRTSSFPLSQQAEECLSLSVFIPEDAKPSMIGHLPVLVWIHGGAYNYAAGRGAFLNLPSMVGNAPENTKFIGVSINYRLGALGFLGGSIAKEANILNIGHNDILKSLEWVQSHISKFGGDPAQVTVFGESAGAHAIGTLILDVMPGHKKLFRAAIMNSGGPTSRSYPPPSYPLFEKQTKEFLQGVGCFEEGANTRTTFRCLRGLDVETIRNMSVTVYNRYDKPSLQRAFRVVIDNKFIPEHSSESLKKGHFHKIPVMTGFNTDEASGVFPRNINTTAEFRAFFQALMPAANSSILERVEELYPDPSIPGSPYANSLTSPQFLRMSAAYSDYGYIQGIRHTAVAMSDWEISGAQVFKYHFNGNVTDAAPKMPSFVPEYPHAVYHTAELAFVDRTSSQVELSKMMNAYYASFIVSGGDPNAMVPDDYPKWPVYSTESQLQLRFQGTGAVIEEDTLRREQVDFWRSINTILDR